MSDITDVRCVKIKSYDITLMFLSTPPLSEFLVQGHAVQVSVG